MLDEKPFYEKGLRFECQKDCSGCCGGSPGYVYITEDEIRVIIKHLGISREDFILGYTKQVGDRLSLVDVQKNNWDCVMLKKGKCTIYSIRPMQCRTFPFWPRNIESKDDWRELQHHCPGLNKGRLFSKDEIEDISVGLKTVDSVK
jgi:uncharacterized protein